MSEDIPQVDIAAFVSKLRRDFDVNDLPRRAVFRCARCHRLDPVCVMFVGDDRRPRCTECAEHRLGRSLTLADFPGDDIVRRVIRGEPVTCSEAIRMVRESEGLTQAAFAREVGVSRQMLIRWENGSRFPDYEHSLKLAEMGVDNELLPALCDAK